ncbi:hypothetical protein MPER_10333 [Moniliophthora perniciosa FA553]|nr:hypothetical protein MPER_10333 [Moniliophthora perniciosa FA553]
MVIAILAPGDYDFMGGAASGIWQRKFAEQYRDNAGGMSHAFFVIMGGFALYNGDRSRGYLWNDGEDMYNNKYALKQYIQKVQKIPVPVLLQDGEELSMSGSQALNSDPKPQPTQLLEYFIKNGYITITEDEIKDRSHADFITKSIALIQTTWFILQVAARAAEGLTVTELEIITYPDEPSNSDLFPTRLGKNPLQLYITVYSIAAAFGAIHCIPWAFQFPTHTEQLLWQICAVAVAAAPIAMGCLHWWQKGLQYSTPDWLEALIITTSVLLGIFYIFSRITLIVLALTALRELAPSGYQTVQWTTFIPKHLVMQVLPLCWLTIIPGT